MKLAVWSNLMQVGAENVTHCTTFWRTSNVIQCSTHAGMPKLIRFHLQLSNQKIYQANTYKNARESGEKASHFVFRYLLRFVQGPVPPIPSNIPFVSSGMVEQRWPGGDPVEMMETWWSAQRSKRLLHKCHFQYPENANIQYLKYLIPNR